jgi:hypothetical protein
MLESILDPERWWDQVETPLAILHSGWRRDSRVTKTEATVRYVVVSISDSDSNQHSEYPGSNPGSASLFGLVMLLGSARLHQSAGLMSLLVKKRTKRLLLLLCSKPFVMDVIHYLQQQRFFESSLKLIASLVKCDPDDRIGDQRSAAAEDNG